MNAQVYEVEVIDELRGIMREPTSLFFSILMPVGFFALFASLFGGEDAGATSAGTSMIARLGTFGVLSVVMMNPGIGVAADRERGWLRAKQVSAVPLGVTLAAKVTAALPYAVGVLLAMTITAALLGVLDASAVGLLRVVGVLVLGAAPFALFGLAVGFQAGTNAAAAVLNAILLPAAVVSGLWMPLRMMPDLIADSAQFLPPYHLAQLALAQLSGGAVLDHVLVLVATTIVMAALAAVSYRHARL